MGQSILQFYKTKIKAEYKFAFISTFVISLLVHIYKFVNALPNHDSLYNYYTDQGILDLGRWALSLFCGISSFYDLPWVIGLLSCVYIALTVVVITALFKLNNPVVIGLIGALLAASPSTTETYFFLFTADGYMLSMLLAALAVYFSRIEETRLSRHILSGVLICISCGIYQAYVSFALVLAVLYFMDALLLNKHTKQDCLRWIMRQVVIYVAALAAYYAIWQLCMYFTGMVAGSHQGVSEVGNISIALLVNGLLNSVKSTVLYFLQWNILKFGFTPYNLLNILFLAAAAVGLTIACIKSGVFKRKWATVLLVICLIAIIPFACMWHFTSDSIAYRLRMLQSFTLLFAFTAIMYERWAKTAAKNIICALLVAMVLNNALMANISYYHMNLCYERTYAEGLEMMMAIHDAEDEHSVSKIAVVGEREGVGYEINENKPGDDQYTGQVNILTVMLEKTLLYDSDHVTRFLHANFGMELESVSFDERSDLFNTEQVQQMGCWPSNDSVAVIDDTVVIKLSDVAERR